MNERRPYRYWEDPAWVADSDPKVVAKLIRDQRDLLDKCKGVFIVITQEGCGCCDIPALRMIDSLNMDYTQLSAQAYDRRSTGEGR